jgi:uncharacterized protein
MSRRDLTADLMQAFAEIPVIDAHEHLPPEHVRTGMKVDVFTLFSHYTHLDQTTAGLSEADYERVHNPDLPLEMRWQLFAPILEQIRFGSYARPASIAAKEFYGFDDINEETYRPLSEAMQAANTPGIYRRVIVEKCGIKAALTQHGRTDYEEEYLIPLMPLDHYAAVPNWQQIAQRGREIDGEAPDSLDEYLEMIREGLRKWKKERVVGLKMTSRTYGPPSRAQAWEAFESLRTGSCEWLPDLNPLRDFLMEAMLDMAAEEDLVVAVHTGMWGDFRTLDPQHMIPIIARHPATRFDLYHAGMPWVRETGVIGKNFANVWLNLCWCHIISPKMTRSLLDEWIDLVPVNKILAFGGDYCDPVEKVYGHLLMAREDIAYVLAGRIKEGLLDRDDALLLARKWFHDNPAALYRLPT